MTYEQKALEILRVLAQVAADGKSLTIAEDWGFGSATVINQDGAHTHIGEDSHDDDARSLEAFVDGLHDLLVIGRGLSWAKPSNAQAQGRDMELARMRRRVECLRGGLKSACGWLHDLEDTEHAEMCLEMAGDMEPPLMGSNV